MPDRIGNAAITWTSTDDTNSERVHLLQTPLRELRQAHAEQTWLRESLDRTTIEHVAISSGGSDELAGTVRYDRDSKSLSDLIVAGSEGKTLTYYPNLDDSDVSFGCQLISPRTPMSLSLDQQRGILGDHSIELRLRTTGQTPFAPLLDGTAVLFALAAGGDLSQATFARVTSSSAPASYAALPAYGTLSTAGTSEARISWESTASSEGPRTFPTLLLEDTRTNFVNESEDISTGSTGKWLVVDGTIVRSSSNTDPYGTNIGWIVEDNSTTVQSIVRHDFVGVASTAQLAVSMFFKEGSSAAAGGSLIRLTNVTATVVMLDFTLTWSSGKPSQSFATGSVLPPERWRDGWWRLSGLADGATSTGDTFGFDIRPAKLTVETGDLAVFGAQVE